MSTTLGMFGTSGRSLVERTCYIAEAFLAERLIAILGEKEDDQRNKFLDKAIDFFRLANLGLLINLGFSIPEPNKFTIHDTPGNPSALGNTVVFLQYLKKKDPKMDTPIMVNHYTTYLLTLREFRDHGAYNPKYLEEIIKFYEWYSEYCSNQFR